MTRQDHGGMACGFERLEYARQILRMEADALREVANRLGASFLQAVDLIYSSAGRVCVTGTGKSADVGQKIAGTLNSTGTRAYVLDVTRAVHGDLGMVAPQDVVLALSHSGESEELVRLVPSLKQLARALIALTSNGQSSLARLADVTIALGPITEACPLGLAPSTSTTVMLAVGDALAFVLSRMRNFGQEDFARYHPAGSLGRRLMKVEQMMRRGEHVRLAPARETVRHVFTLCARKGRRTGAVLLVDDSGKLAGIFTDSDLARLFEQRRDAALDRPIAEVMTRQPITVPAGTRVWDAVEIMSRHRISELPVVDSEGRPVGLLDITDVLSWIPAESGAAEVEEVHARAA
ncbi:MAG: KpsF/GutQ family sugar-phosphate isomerase [Gemmatales bacterium]|nr:KpsF/GutQ family sugar-phosphate isomerase [Gemmatales bacterium]MDW8223393.1 KpsF/GutQ family sugar-phosphate isomerase [Gemmatales bacterium]